MTLSTYFMEATYLIASILFVFSLKGMSHPETARRGMFFAEGGMLAANYTIPFALAQAGGLTHTYANGVSPTVNLVQPGTLYGDRINELDFKLAKVFRFGHTRLNAGGEVYNSLNSASVLTYNQVFNPAVPAGPGGWLQPTQIMTPRFFKLTAQFDF